MMSLTMATTMRESPGLVPQGMLDPVSALCLLSACSARAHALLIPFFIQISGVDRIIAHSGALGERQVLPNEAVSWSASTTKRSLAALALAEQNSDLGELYVRRRRAPPEAAWSPRARGARLVPKAR